MALPELEFFILSIVFEHYHRLSIFESPDLGRAVSRHPPEFTRNELIDTLSDLFCCGDLTARCNREGSQSRPFVPTRDEIDAGLCGALDIAYGLTRQGGARWEKMRGSIWKFHLSGFDE